MCLASLRVEYAELLDRAAPLDGRIRCLYRLKEMHKTIEGAAILAEAVDTTDSVLLQHELVYNIGQFGFEESIPALKWIVENPSYDVVSRHEAVEALGAIAQEAVLPFLLEYADKNGPAAACPPIRESAILAILRIQMKTRDGTSALAPPKGCHFVSVDPSPAFGGETKSLSELESILMTGQIHNNGCSLVSSQEETKDTSGDAAPAVANKDDDDALWTTLWNRYRAMFSLRNLGTREAAIVLGKALRADTTSCLFRHEIAFVLGQMEHPASEPFLAEALADEGEHAMVRHEAAEAIGAIAEKHSLAFLENYAHHDEAIVKDSCVVALDMHKYWSKFKKQEEA
jgi:deoxyhypusine monooxygenase